MTQNFSETHYKIDRTFALFKSKKNFQSGQILIEALFVLATILLITLATIEFLKTSSIELRKVRAAERQNYVPKYYDSKNN